ncbi:MAG TPA: MogA/MoaB family molybdenum cofactor biosynthesis protein [bacterium]|nr:MogA/MoaB family molybdenum cofactor biosynthesis protein [bacterium]HPJ71410.1 MogA/MoaB family molybdenum cofactor biosynthesis protein [bacterium]HPQ65915.1 MogA/MoaB family molybdenum cofactor biosynthesis protein [bacterium]
MNGFRVGIVVLSDSASRGERPDLSGPLLVELAEGEGWEALPVRRIPDEPEALAREIVDLIEGAGADLILTSGGTGLSPRDRTPEATVPLLDFQVPGIPELLRAQGRRKNPAAVLSRGVAGVRGRTLIVNLPGSPRAVEESWPLLAPIVPHALAVASGGVRECGRGAEGG